jgi:predicted nucleic acid-binding Zn ribbon protein
MTKKGKAKPRKECVICGHPVAKDLQHYCPLHAEKLQIEIREEMRYAKDAEKFQRKNL